MKMCPKATRKMIDLSWDSIDEQYKAMRDKVMTRAVNKAEEGGPVPLEVGGVVPEAGWRLVNEWDGEGWGEEGEEEEVGAVYLYTRALLLPRVWTHDEGMSE